MSSLARRLAQIIRARLHRDTTSAEDTPPSSSRGPSRPSSPPPSEPPRDPTVDPVLAGYYANLELPYGADFEAVSQARKRLMRRYHPDLHASDPEKQRVATELVQGLNRAYEGLRKHLEDDG